MVLLVLGAVSIVEALRLHDGWQEARLMPAVIGFADIPEMGIRK